MVATALDAVVAQRLMRRVCDSCVQPTEPSARHMTWLKSQIGDDAENIDFQQGAGCAYCGNTGYRGRIGVYEFLEVDDEISDALRRNAHDEFDRAAHRQKGFRTLVQSAIEQVRLGLSTLEEALRVSGEISDIELDDEIAKPSAIKPPPGTNENAPTTELKMSPPETPES